MRCKYDRAAGELALDAEQKIKDMLKRFPELAKLPYKTVPLQPSQVNRELKVGELKPLSEIDEYIIAEYPKIVETMIYIAITARPGVAFAVGKVISRYALSQRTSRWHVEGRRKLSPQYDHFATSIHSQVFASIDALCRIAFGRCGSGRVSQSQL